MGVSIFICAGISNISDHEKKPAPLYTASCLYLVDATQPDDFCSPL